MPIYSTSGKVYEDDTDVLLEQPIVHEAEPKPERARVVVTPEPPKDIDQSVFGTVRRWLGMDGSEPITEIKADPLKFFPTKEDADFARKYGFSYGKNYESATDRGDTRVLGVQGYKNEFRPISAAGLDLRTVAKAVESPEFSKIIENNPDAADSFMKAALTANRIPLATLGFDPARIVTDTQIGSNVTVGGIYDRRGDNIYSVVGDRSPKFDSTLVHESIHRGLGIVRQTPEGKKLIEDTGVDEESIVRYIMATQAGNPEEGGGEAGDNQIKFARKLLENNSVRREALERLQDYAAKLHYQRTPKGHASIGSDTLEGNSAEDVIVPETDSTMPLGATEKPVDALKSTGSSQTPGRSVWDKLTGNDGGERYQLWPERAVREVVDNVRTLMTTEPGSEANIQASARVAFDLGLGGLATAGMKPGAGVFGGRIGALSTDLRNQKGAVNLRNAETAAKMEKEGVIPAEIWEKTGWYRDYRDQRWKFEISDADSKFIKPPREGKWKAQLEEGFDIDKEWEKLVRGEPVTAPKLFEVIGGSKLGEVFHHPELYKAYPELKNLKVFYDPDLPAREWGGMYSMESDSKLAEDAIVFGRGAFEGEISRPHRVLLHEIQHWIQHKESFSQGGNVGQMKEKMPEDLKKIYDKTWPKYQELLTKGRDNLTEAELKQLEEARFKIVAFEMHNQMLEQKAFKAYQRLGGEIESRNVADRFLRDLLGLTKKRQHPHLTEDNLGGPNPAVP